MACHSPRLPASGFNCDRDPVSQPLIHGSGLACRSAARADRPLRSSDRLHDQLTVHHGPVQSPTWCGREQGEELVFDVAL